MIGVLGDGKGYSRRPIGCKTPTGRMLVAWAHDVHSAAGLGTKFR